MGWGSLREQFRSRFNKGDYIDTEEKEEWLNCEQAYKQIIDFGEYKVGKTENEEYELLKDNTLVSAFSEALMEEGRILFPLSHGMLLEISESGARKILTPEKAELCGLIAAEGSLYPYERKVHNQIFFHSADMEIIEKHIELFKKVYGVTPHIYQGKGEFIAGIKNKEAYYDLREIGVKTGPYRYHVPIEHLDEKGSKAYLKGFFSGDGSVIQHGKYAIKLRITSKYGDCLEEIREAMLKVGFQPSEVRLDKTYGAHYLEIYAHDRIKFIKEIGSYSPAHVEKFERFLEAYKEGKVRRGRPKKREDG